MPNTCIVLWKCHNGIMNTTDPSQAQSQNETSTETLLLGIDSRIFLRGLNIRYVRRVPQKKRENKESLMQKKIAKTFTHNTIKRTMRCRTCCRAMPKKCGPYHKLSDSLRAEIGKWACDAKVDVLKTAV